MILFTEPFNFPQAIKLPEKVIAPITIADKIVATIVALVVLISEFPNSTIPIKAALAPPNPLNNDTNSGIFVISTLIAMNQPMIAPNKIAIPIST